jgi:hypothetical protein
MGPGFEQESNDDKPLLLWGLDWIRAEPRSRDKLHQQYSTVQYHSTYILEFAHNNCRLAMRMCSAVQIHNIHNINEP